MVSFRSTDGGASWSDITQISTFERRQVAGQLRDGALPSADVDAAGRVYVVWQDCRFRLDCRSHDLVLSTSVDGLTWTEPVRIPLDPLTSRFDHFIPGLAVKPGTSGDTAHLAVTYYFYPDTNCSVGTCRLTVGFTSSPDGGQSWTRPLALAGPMNITDIALTTSGRMVGDYISTSFVGDRAYPFFAVGKPKDGPMYDEAIYTTAVPLP